MESEAGRASPINDFPKTACSNCRKHKIRCQNAFDSQPCSRCRKMKLSCTYEPRRLRGEKRKEALAQEISLSKAQMISPAYSTSGKESNGGSPAVSGSMQMSMSPVSAQNPVHLMKTNLTILSELPPQLHSIPRSMSDPLVIGRSLDGLYLNGEIISDLFSIFFLHFSPFVPILDPSLHVNDYYMQSPLLFWSIAAVACRRYNKDPTLRGVLPTKALDLAMKTVFAATAGISAIESILLLLVWPPPPNPTYDEVPHVLSSALIHAAMRIGLQVPHASQEFSRVKLNLSDNELNRRFHLWTYCLLLYQRSTCCVGNGFCQFITLPSVETEKYLRNLDPSLRLQRDLQDVVCKAAMSLAENGLDLTTGEQQRSFDIIYKGFVDRLSHIRGVGSTATGLDKVYIAIAQVMVQSFQFFRPSDKHISGDLLALYACSSSLIEELETLEKMSGIVSHGTYYIFQGTVLATCCLLRLLKTPLIPCDLAEGQRYFFGALNLLDIFSAVNDDTSARAAVTMKRLWRSNKAFKNKDGSWNFELRVRNRFAISSLFDCIWWSHEEFGGQSDAFPRRSSSEVLIGQVPNPNIMDHYLFSDMTLEQDWMMNGWLAYSPLAGMNDDGSFAQTQEQSCLL